MKSHLVVERVGGTRLVGRVVGPEELIPQPKRHAKPTKEGKATDSVFHELRDLLREALPGKSSRIIEEMAAEIVRVGEAHAGMRVFLEQRGAGVASFLHHVDKLGKAVLDVQKAVALLTPETDAMTGDLTRISDAVSIESAKAQIQGKVGVPISVKPSHLTPAKDVGDLYAAARRVAESLDIVETHHRTPAGRRAKAHARGYVAALLGQLRTFKVKPEFHRRFVVLMTRATGHDVKDVDYFIKMQRPEKPRR